MVQPFLYDEFGRESRRYLPVVPGSQDGIYRDDILDGAGNYVGDAESFYDGEDDQIANDQNPYSETRFEASPLNRILEQGAPGVSWQPDAVDSYVLNGDRTIKKTYEFNQANEVRQWKYAYPTEAAPLGIVTGTGTGNLYYPANYFYKNKTKDEQHREVIEYVDKEGRTVLKRVQVSTTDNPSTTDSNRDSNWASTYYIYDDFGSLVCVVPPEASKILTSTVIPFAWASLTGITASVDHKLTKTAATGYANSGAYYGTALAASTNGWVRMVAGETNTSRMIGLTTTNGGTNTNIGFALELASDGHVYVWEDNVKMNDLGVYTIGTSVMIARENGSVKYYVNDIFKLTSPKTVSTPSTAALYVDATINEIGGTIKDVDISWSAEKATLNNFAFLYSYDGRKRMTHKQVPGAAAVYMVYDKRDRLVLTQDGNQRAGATNAIKYWAFTKYDEYNRPIFTGIKDTTTTVQLTQAQMQAVVDAYYDPAKPWRKHGETYAGAGNIHGYSNVAYPKVNTVVSSVAINDPDRYLTVTYYDNYNFKSLWPTGYDYQTDGLSQTVSGYTYPEPGNTSFNERVIGQVTGMKTKVIDGLPNTGYTWLKSINYYDNKYRVIQNKSDNLKGGIDRVSNLYDFVGKILKTQTTHDESDVTWIDRTNVIVSGNVLKSTSTSSGAASQQQLLAGVNGWLEVIFSEYGTTRYVGLNDVNTDLGYANINYAFKFSGTATSGTVNVLENGTTKATITGVKPGEIFKISRTGTVVKYYRNGVEIPLSPASMASTTLLMADASFASTNATLAGVRTSFSTTSNTILRTLEYDHAGRLTLTWHKLNGGTNILLSKNEYNELGQLVDKKLHSTVATAADAKQSVDYRYSIRGWLTSMNNASLTSEAGINDDLNDYFGMSLNYNTEDTDLGNSQLYNGNISAMKWSNYGDGTIKQKGYTYSYDPMNRITGSTYKERTTTWAALANSGFAETGFTYDLNGNIKTLTRNDKRASGTMDILAYDYGGTIPVSNKLLKVTDTGDINTGFKDGNTTNNDYTYDANGNMTIDLNKGISAITYNHLNLPFTITKGGNTVTYLYDATGRKLAQVVNSNNTIKQTDYAGEFVYENDVLLFVSHEEGRIVTSATKLVYTNPCQTLTDFTASNASISAVTANGTEKYVQVLTSSTTGPAGITTMGGAFSVIGGERYKIRVRGYHDNVNPTYLATLRVRVDGVTVPAANALLPKGPSNESWIETIVTIPGTATQKLLQLGIMWEAATLASNQKIMINEIEIVQLLNTTAEYQYNLKDHLGNTRLTFTAKEETISEKATMETANTNAEATQFLYYNEAKKVNEPIFDKTNAGGTYYATRLTGGTTNAIYGLAKSISVMPGDVVNMEVYAKYVDENAIQPGAFRDLVLGIIANSPAVSSVSIDGGTAGSLGTGGSYPFTPINHTDNSSAPKAYLNYILFNKDMTTVLASNFARITTNSREYGQDVAHDKLVLTDTIEEPGYMYIYLSNENPTAVEVYFDDFKVDHIKSPIVQVDDYYPFGLTFNSFNRENGLANKFVKFQGQEHVDDLGLNWDSFKWRNHQPEIGRFFNMDPLTEKYLYNSPYAFSENRVVDGRELEGLEYAPARGPDGQVDGNGTIATLGVPNASNALELFNNPSEALSIISENKAYINGSAKKYGISPQLIGSIIFQEQTAGARGDLKNSVGKVLKGNDPTLSLGLGEMQIGLAADLMGLDSKNLTSEQVEMLITILEDPQQSIELIAMNIMDMQNFVGRELTVEEVAVGHNAGKKALKAKLEDGCVDESEKTRVSKRSEEYQDEISTALQ